MGDLSEVIIPKIKLNNGIDMPRIGLGTFHSSEPNNDQMESAIIDAIQVGYRHFDCADFYQNELGIGKGIKKAIDDGMVKREDLFVTSKVWMTFTRPDRVEKSLRRSLKALNVQYVDLFFMHWPMSLKQNDEDYIPIGEDGLVDIDTQIDYVDTWKAIEECYQKG